MRKLNELFKRSRWVLNQKGIIPALIMAGGGILASQLSKKKQEEPQYYTDPWTQKLRDMATPRMEESYYNIDPSAVQTATGQQLSSRLARTPEQIATKFGPQAAEPYQAAKGRMSERFGEEETYLKDMLQREGVLTSTPGIEEKMKLKRSQGSELEELSQRLMYEDINRQIQANETAENIIANTINQGTAFGGMEYGQAQWPYQMAGDVLSGAQGLQSVGYMPESTPSLGEELGGAGMDIGKMMLLLNMLKGTSKGTSSGTTGITGGVGGKTMNTQQFGQVWSPYKY